MIPNDILADYMNILVVASATATGNMDDKGIRLRVIRLGEIVARLSKKHLSDGDNPSDKRRFSIELFETALKIAKGDLVP